MTAIKNTLRMTGARLRHRAGTGLVALTLLAPSLAMAETILQDISFASGNSGRVDITLHLSEAAVDAQVFTTDEPPRIAIDLADTRNAVSQRRIAVGTGATSAINAVEAAGRTRVVIDLFRPASYETRMEGTNFVLSVSGADTNAAFRNAVLPASTDPAKQLPGQVQLANVDFRRTPEGAGRVILAFDRAGAAADMKVQNQSVVVDLPGVVLAEGQKQRLDVIDFATPVQIIEVTDSGNGARLILNARGEFETMAYQSGNEYVLEVASPQVAAEVAGADGEAEEDDFGGKPVTFNFQDIPVRTVLQLIAEESGLNVVAADTVVGNVTLRLINVPWDQALDIVLRAKQLDQRRDGNVIWVAPQKEIADFEKAKADARIALQELAPVRTEYIAINYGSAEEIAKLLTEESLVSQSAGSGGGGAGGGATQARGFLSTRGSVTFDPRTNTLLLSETEEKIAEIRRLVDLLDRPVDQVLIEARIVIASEDFARELGARFGISGAYEDGNGNLVTTSGGVTANDQMVNTSLQHRFGLGQQLIGRRASPVVAPGDTVGSQVQSPLLADRLNVNLPITNPAGSIGFAILGADYLLDLELSALEREGRGEIVASPRVITANQREAVIRQGDEIGYVTVQPSSGGVATQTVDFKEAVLELKVVPRITQDGRVFLTMEIKKDDLAGFISTTAGNVPQIDKRQVNTAVLVENSQTVVIGGVYEFQSREDLSKVPFLGDVPVLGNLFKRRGRTSEKAELLIFVTPKILSIPGRRE